MGVFASVVLVAATLLLGTTAGPLLDKARWTIRNPGVALVCWIAALAGMLAAVAGLIAPTLLWPPAPGHELLELVHTCVGDHSHPGLLWGFLASTVLLAVCCLRLWRTVPRLWRAVFRRRRHRAMLDLIAREDVRHADVLVLDHPLPVVYCLPSRRRPIVVSSGAQERLEGEQMAAVLAHERAHLRQRHHLVLLFVDLAHSLLPWSPTTRRALKSVALLSEMAADDAATRRCGREALLEALRRFVTLPGPAGTLAATGTQERQLTRRLTRLESSDGRPRRGARVLGWASGACAAVAPPVLVALAVAAIPMPC